MSRSGGRRRNDSSDDEFQYNSDSDFESANENIELRRSGRTIRKSATYDGFANDMAEEDYEEEDNTEYDEFGGNGKIDKIFLSRQTSSGLEYLVNFQESRTPFSYWVAQEMCTSFPNFKRVLEKFNDTEMKLSFYITYACDNVFDTSFKSPLHVIAHRPLNNDISSNSLEYLCQFNLETGTAFVWEPNTADAPQKIIEHYNKTRICVENFHGPRPESIQIDETNNNYKSVDGFVPRNYQIDGVNWMLKCFTANHGCILADEMGLGKTIQALVFLSHLNKYTDFHGPHLIAVGTNTYAQWCGELERWSDLKYIPYNGQPETRDLVCEYQIPYFDDVGNKIEDKYGFNILLATYDIVLKDMEFMSKIDWQVVMVDEGHRLKNINGKKHNAFIALNSLYRVILTGTPIQSTLQELWTLLNFVSPEFFQDETIFPDDDVESLEEEVLDDLRQRIAPHIMRRSLLDVERSVVPKDERIAYLMPTVEQKEMFRLTKMHELWRVKQTNDESSLESNTLQRICNHPFLVEGAESYYMSQRQMQRLQLMIVSSAKFIILDRLLPIFRRNGRSVLIFSQRLKVLKMLQEYCQLRKYSNVMLIGTMSDQEKKEALDKFCDPNKDIFVFLISTRSGSEGLNLTKASITIIFDPDWNPQNDLQALGRCHRIGQTQKVDVIRLITYGTYEHQMFSRAQRKLKLWLHLLGNGTITDPALAQKCESTVIEEKTMNEQNLMCPQSLNDITQVDSFVTTFVPKEDDVVPMEVQRIEIPPELRPGESMDPDIDFKEVLQRSSTVVHEMSLVGSTPVLDISMGLTDDEFLQRFPADPSVISEIKKHRMKTPIIQRVPIESKTAKKIIKFLELHGYGEWDAIHSSVKRFCPIEQLIKVCQTAIILNFRACDPSMASCFPLLVQCLFNDIQQLELSMIMCNDQDMWIKGFKKRSISSGETPIFKQISGYIHKTCIQFLSKLEHHLLIEEWRRDEEHTTFPFSKLPPMFGRIPQQDMDLYDAIIDGRATTGEETTRVGQIYSVIRSELLLRSKPLLGYVFQYWSSNEVMAIINTYRNFGNIVRTMEPKILHSKTCLLSKTTDMVFDMARKLASLFSIRKPDTPQPMIIEDEMALLSKAPLECREEIVIENKEATNTVKRIMINNHIRIAKKYIEDKLASNATKLDEVVNNGKGWWTINHCIKLFQLIIEFGMDSLTSILLNDDLFRLNFTVDDIEYLKTFNRIHLKEESQIPDFILNENKFYSFLKSMSGQPKKKIPMTEQEYLIFKRNLQIKNPKFYHYLVSHQITLRQFHELYNKRQQQIQQGKAAAGQTTAPRPPPMPQGQPPTPPMMNANNRQLFDNYMRQRQMMEFQQQQLQQQQQQQMQQRNQYDTMAKKEITYPSMPQIKHINDVVPPEKRLKFLMPNTKRVEFTHGGLPC